MVLGILQKDMEFIKTERNAAIFLNKKFISYPIELNLNELDKKTVSNVVIDIVKLINSKNLDNYEYKNFKEFLLNNFG